MTKERCLTITPAIRDLAAELQGETLNSVKGLVALWQEKHNKDWDIYPSAKELSIFRDELRSKTEASEMLDEALSSTFNIPSVSTLEEQERVEKDFTIQTRRDRVSLIARMFSQEIDYALDEHKASLERRIKAADDMGDTTLSTDLKEELFSLDRFTIIKKFTPGGLFKRVYDSFAGFFNSTQEEQIDAEVKELKGLKGIEKYSEEKILDSAKKRVEYKAVAYKKILNNFKALSEESSRILLQTEGIRIDINYVAPKEANLNDDTPDGESVLDNRSDSFLKEEVFKDGWMSKYKEVSSHESLSQRVRKMIREIPKLNYKGMFDRDDLGNQRFLDPDYVHATLIDKLKDMITSEDMIPMLEELQRTKPWIELLIRELQADESLFSQFYQDFRKDFLPYWIQKRKLQPDGTFKITTISINKPEGVYYLLDQWRDNYESGTLLDDDSIYDTNGDIVVDNAIKGLEWTESLNSKFSNLSTDQGIELLQNERVWKSLNKLLNMVGIDANPAVLMDALTNVKRTEGITFTDPVTQLLSSLNIIFSGIRKGKLKVEENEYGIRREDLINNFGSAYNTIALMLAEVTEDAIESSVRENDKSFFSHVNPNYLGKLIKQLKNVRGDRTKFDEFIEKEFGQYEWFRKDGRWLNDWLYQIVNNPDIRRGMTHKVLLNFDKIEYQDWDPLDYTLVLLTEYFSDPDNTATNLQWAYYHLPILSDTPSAEFIRFRKYTDRSIIGEDGNFKRYDDIILTKMVDLVSQEMGRMALVVQRDNKYREGSTEVAPIANFDIKRDKEGKIKSKGGAEFKFLPALDTYKTEDGVSFIDKVREIQENGTGKELESFIKATLMEIMDTEFEKAYKAWHKMGLFDETNSGNYKWLSMMGLKEGQLKYNRATASSLLKASQILREDWSSSMGRLLKDYNTNSPVDNRAATLVFEQIKNALGERLERGEITLSEYNSLANNLEIRNKAKDKLREYFYNSKFATSQIIQLTTTDLAFYKNLEDFQKRYKEVHAPSVRLNTHSKYGREIEKTVYLPDQEIVSNSLSEAEEIIRRRLSKKEADVVIKKLKEVNVADAQAYRSLSSYRAILDMSGQWTDEMQNAFDNFQNDTWSMADFNIIWQTKKPFVYTQVNSISGIEGHTGIKTPVQHKNSEFLLMAIYSILGGPLTQSNKLRAINEFMEERGIDVVQFESTTKVGKQGVYDTSIHDLDSVDDIKKALNNYAFPNNQENPNVVHSISYEDYGIQVETPEHVIDTIQLIGTQIRKLVTADISDDTVITMEGVKKTKKEWLKLYNAINTENILQAFREIDEIFNDPKEVERVLLEEVRGSQRYGIDMIRACTLDNNGLFNIPLFDPVQSQRVQSLLNSIIKSRVTKQKIKGGALIQVSAYGLSDKLNIVYEGEGENKRIKHFECLMPAYSRKFYEPLMKEGTHELDISKLPEDLRKLIGYRVPTEDKYSMVPLYIKGFLPQQNGSSIMLPAEITTLSGSDFDVDKLYIMLPEFKIISKYDKETFARNLVATLTKGKKYDPEQIRDYEERVVKVVDSGKYAVENSSEYNIWKTFLQERENYRIAGEDKIVKVKYDYSKTPQENSLEARNNALIDMMWGVLTNSDTASKILNPGGFDSQKEAARICTILKYAGERDLRKALNANDSSSTISVLLNKSLDELSEIAQEFEEKLDPLSPTTQVALHQRNMVGANLIGIYANHNANHALMQHTNLAVDEKNGSFMLNGRIETSLHQVKNAYGVYISRLNAGFLAASVDNAKDPVLAALNQNTLTADIAMLLSRLSYNAVEIGLFLNQPIVLDIVQSYFRQKRDGKSKNYVIDEIIEEYRKEAGMMESVTYDNYKSNKFSIDELADNIILQKEVEELGYTGQTNDYRKVSFYKKQVAVGYLFKRVLTTADALGQLVQSTRSDTQGGAAGPTIADTLVKLVKMQDFIDNVVNSAKSPLINADVITDTIEIDGKSTSEIREELLDSPLPFLQAFFSLGIQATNNMLSKYFPQYSESFMNVVNTLRGFTKLNRLDVKTINNIHNDLFAYIMSKTRFFGQEVDWQDSDVSKNPIRILSSSDKRGNFINNFPNYFNSVLERNPQIAELGFIKRLKVIRAGKNNPVDVIVFKNVGQLSPNLREEFMRDWQSLLYMGPEAQSLALNLFRYSYYRNGFAFGPNSFIHLAPVAVRKLVPEYIETLRNLLDEQDDYSYFVNQYVYNHLDNRKIVPEVSQEANIRFLDESKKPLETVHVHLERNESYATKTIVREQREVDGEPEFDFLNFIARSHGDGYIYYRLVESSSKDALYERIEPLGYKNSFIEYEYGKDASEMKSVIQKNDREYNPNQNDDVTAFDNEVQVDYDSTSDPIRTDSIESVESKVVQESFERVYGVELEENTGSENDFYSLEPNMEYRDANNEKIC